MPPILITALAVVGAGSVVVLVAKGLLAIGAPAKVASEVEKVPDVLQLTAGKGTGVQAAGILGHYLEIALKQEISADELTAALQFAETNPSPAQAVAWLEANVGPDFLKKCEAQLPDLAHDELALYGDHVPTVIKDMIGKLLPGTIVAQANTVADAKTVRAKLAALAGATGQPIDPTSGKAPAPAAAS